MPADRPPPRTLTIDGELRLCIRPITPEDRERVLEGLRSISVETSYHRFFTPAFYPSERELQYLTEVDYVRHVALGAIDCTREGEPGIGAARYVRLADAPEVAEAAVLVIDDYQQRGIGSLLLAALSRHAAEDGVEVFRAYVLEENRPFLRYLRAFGARREAVRDGVVQIDVPVYADPDEVPRNEKTERALWAWRCIERAEIGEC